MTGSLVARLCKPFEQRNYCTYMYIYRSLLHICNGRRILTRQQGTRLCGTALPNTVEKNFLLILKKSPGSHSLLFNGKSAAVAWCVKKTIYFLTSKYISEPIVTVMSYDTKDHKRMPVTCPGLVKAYNSCMDSTGRNDQMTKLQGFRLI